MANEKHLKIRRQGQPRGTIGWLKKIKITRGCFLERIRYYDVFLGLGAQINGPFGSRDKSSHLIW
jgi:hypothetical protein